MTAAARNAFLEFAGALRRYSGPVAAIVTPLGWVVTGATVGCWFLALQFGWVELNMVAVACALLMVCAVFFTLGRARFEVEVQLDPPRVVVGEPAAGQVTVTNVARTRLLPSELELPVGASTGVFQIPSLAPGASHEDLFVAPTNRRAVVTVGPATTVRGDPLGLLRRRAPWTGVKQLFVHPVTVPLEPLGAGLLRDLEGQTTQDLSPSDLAFHALREYAPGDDRRHIHWRSSAKVGGGVPGGKLLVRQYHDTRRSHLTVIVDGKTTSYLDPDDFELAVSAAASATVRAVRDNIQTTVVAADQATHEVGADYVLDGFSRAHFGAGAVLASLAAEGARLAPDTSVVLLVTGPVLPFTDLQRACTHFAPEVNTVALRVDPTQPTSITGTTALTVLNLPHLGDLASLLRGSGLR